MERHRQAVARLAHAWCFPKLCIGQDAVKRSTALWQGWISAVNSDGCFSELASIHLVQLFV
ncbi:Protein of unknown function [Gryllus bimaculatus]|nr:Protein of unknown function [Gryllus bimaculatus]